MADKFKYQVRTNNKSNRIVRKYRNYKDFAEDNTDYERFLKMVCNGISLLEEGKFKWVIAS